MNDNESLLNEGPHYQKLSAADRKEHWHDHIALGVWGKAGDVDFFLCHGVYHVGGKKWGLEDKSTGLIQTNFLVTDNKHREMTDTPQVGTRMDPVAGYPVEITADAESCTWKAGNRTMTRRGNEWTLTGEHAGVDMNIHAVALGEAVPYHGTWDKVETVGMAGNEQLCRATGTFSYEGKTYTITEGWAIRERSLFGNGWDVASNLSRTTNRNYFWAWVFSEEIKVFFYEQAGSGGSEATVYFKDNTKMQFTAEQTKAVITKTWADPLIRDTLATALSIVMESPEGKLELELGTWARGLFGFNLKHGYTIHSGAIGRTNGKFTKPDGTVIPVEEAPTYIEQGFALMLPAV